MKGALFQHKKKKGVYRVRDRFPAKADHAEGDRIALSLPEGNMELLVTDATRSGEELVAYQDVATGRLFARPARLFDDPRRFVPLAPYTVADLIAALTHLPQGLPVWTDDGQGDVGPLNLLPSVKRVAYHLHDPERHIGDWWPAELLGPEDDLRTAMEVVVL